MNDDKSVATTVSRWRFRQTPTDYAIC